MAYKVGQRVKAGHRVKIGQRVTMIGDTYARGWRKRVVVPDGMAGTVGNKYGIPGRAIVVVFDNGFVATVPAKYLKPIDG